MTSHHAQTADQTCVSLSKLDLTKAPRAPGTGGHGAFCMLHAPHMTKKTGAEAPQVPYSKHVLFHTFTMQAYVQTFAFLFLGHTQAHHQINTF